LRVSFCRVLFCVWLCFSPYTPFYLHYDRRGSQCAVLCCAVLCCTLLCCVWGAEKCEQLAKVECFFSTLWNSSSSPLIGESHDGMLSAFAHSTSLPPYRLMYTQLYRLMGATHFGRKRDSLFSRTTVLILAICHETRRVVLIEAIL